MPLEEINDVGVVVDWVSWELVLQEDKTVVTLIQIGQALGMPLN